MKKVILITTLLISSVSSTVFANNDGVYVGGQLGYSQNKNDSNNESITELNGKAIPTTANTSIDDDGLGGQVYLGYQINKYFAVETGFTQFADTHIDNAFGVSGYDFDLNSSSFDLVGKGILPITDKFHLFAKGGISRLKQDTLNYAAFTFIDEETDDTSSLYFPAHVETQNSFKPTYGIGAEYELTENLTTNISYMKIGTNSQDPSLTSIGLNYSFK